jgi:hypothetical protein
MPKSKSQMPLLDLFVFLLVRDGVNTRYRLLREGSISLGAAAPALRRLEAKNYVVRQAGKKGKPVVGNRGSQPLQLGFLSIDFPYSDWLATCEQDLPSDIESVARLVAIAEAENKIDLVIDLLDHAIGQRRSRARRSKPMTSPSLIATRSQSILLAAEAARLKAEADVLEKVRATFQRP